CRKQLPNGNKPDSPVSTRNRLYFGYQGPYPSLAFGTRRLGVSDRDLWAITDGLLRTGQPRLDLWSMVILGSVPLAEKALISRLRRAARRRNANLVTGIGEDCAAVRLPAGEAGLDTIEFKVSLAGGDTAESPAGILADIVVLGSVPRGRAILRSGARPGDRIYVTGELGGASAALQELFARHKMRPQDFPRHFHPVPRIS